MPAVRSPRVSQVGTLLRPGREKVYSAVTRTKRRLPTRSTKVCGLDKIDVAVRSDLRLVELYGILLDEAVGLALRLDCARVEHQLGQPDGFVRHRQFVLRHLIRHLFLAENLLKGLLGSFSIIGGVKIGDDCFERDPS